MLKFTEWSDGRVRDRIEKPARNVSRQRQVDEVTVHSRMPCRTRTHPHTLSLQNWTASLPPSPSHSPDPHSLDLPRAKQTKRERRIARGTARGRSRSDEPNQVHYRSVGARIQQSTSNVEQEWAEKKVWGDLAGCSALNRDPSRKEIVIAALKNERMNERAAIG